MNETNDAMNELDWKPGLWQKDQWSPQLRYLEADISHWFNQFPEGTVIKLRSWERTYSVSVHLPELAEPYQIISKIPASAPWTNFASFFIRLETKILEWIPSVYGEGWDV